MSTEDPDRDYYKEAVEKDLIADIDARQPVMDKGAGRDKQRIKELLDMLRRVRKHGGIENLAQLDEMDELIARSQTP